MLTKRESSCTRQGQEGLRHRRPRGGHRLLQGRRHRLQRPEEGHHHRQGRHQQPHDQQPHAPPGGKGRAHPLRGGALRPGDRREEGLHRPPGGHRPQHLRRSFAKRYGVEEGIVFDEPTFEFSYKNDDLGDPLINDYHALALKLATKEEIELIKSTPLRSTTI